MVTRSRKKVQKNLVKNKNIQLAIVAVAVVLILVILGLAIFSGNAGHSYALYLKDKEIFYTSAGKLKPWQTTEQFIDTEEIDASDLTDAATYLGLYTKVSSDGKTIFFFDKVTEEGGNLYYRRINKSNKEPKKIAENVSEFVLDEKADCVTYLKEGTLYQFNMKKSQKLVEEVEDFYVSEDAKTIVYLNSDDEIYFKGKAKSAEKIDSDITRIVNVSEECDTVHYLKDDTLYQKQMGRDKVKIASDVYSVPKVYESGELYFLVEETREFVLKDYVEDDMKEKDAEMKEPKASDYKDDNEYQDAYYEYYERQEREELRLQLEDGMLETSTYELFYYNGKKAVSVAKGTASGVDVAEDTAVAVYAVYDKAKTEKVKLSEVDYMFEIEDLVEEALFASSKCYVAVGKKSSEIQQKNAYDFEIDADGKTLYFIDNISGETGHGDLYTAKISGGKVKNPKKYDTKVYKYGAGFVSEGQYVYYKAVDDEGDSGELYVNKKKVDNNVDLYNMIYIEATQDFVYMTGWNDDKDFGLLKLYNGNKSVEIAKKVYDYNLLPGGEVVLLSEYDEGECKGILSVYRKGKTKKVDEGVAAIIPVN